MARKGEIQPISVRIDRSLATRYILKTASGSEQLAEAPGLGSRWRICGFIASCAGTTVRDATITYTPIGGVAGGVNGTLYGQSLDDQVGAVENLPGFVDCEENTAVNAVLSGASENGVHFTLYAEVVPAL